MSLAKDIFKARQSKVVSVPVKPKGKFQFSKGQVFSIPPMNAITLNVGSRAMPSLRGITDVPLEARSNFSWENPEHVKKYKSELNLPSDFMSPIFNQQHCGSCWAVSTAQVFSDRWAIANKVSNPKFSPTFLLSCTMKYQKEEPQFKDVPPAYLPMGGCQGGMPAEAVDFINKVGISTLACWNYDWCNNSKGCSSSQSRGEGADINDLIPKCPQYDVCVNIEGGDVKQSPSEKIYKCKKWSDVKVVQVPDIYFDKIDDTTETVKQMSSIGSAKTFVARDHSNEEERVVYHNNVINDIKEEIYKRGPVVACFHIIYPTFFGVRGFEPDFYTNTWIDGIYIHVDSDNLGRYYMNTQGALGGHAVAIVGWGQQELTFNDVPDFLKENVSTNNREYQRILDVYKSLRGKKIPYWIVRNSWGESAPNHNNGYFKMAMSDPVIGINMFASLDVPKKLGKDYFGGVTAMLPELSSEGFKGGKGQHVGVIKSGQECGEGPSSDVIKDLIGSTGATQPEKKSFFKRYGMLIILILIILIGGLYYMRKKKEMKSSYYYF
jgi:hypothetical protein